MGCYWVLFFLLISSVYGQDVNVCGDVRDSGDGITFSLDENNTYGDPICIFEMTSGSELQLTFLKDKFLYTITKSQDNSKYVLHAIEAFDYEQGKHEFTFSINFPNGSTPFTLKINNIDDEPPTLAAASCTFDENKLYDAASSECNVLVGDPDGFLSQITFEIINSGNTELEDQIFKLEFESPPSDNEFSTDAYITVTAKLDYENIVFYSFSVRVKDGAGHTPIQGDVRMLVYVNDLNDMPPEWTKYITNTQIDEEHSYTDFSVAAVDGDKGINDDILYEIFNDESGYITIDKNNGNIIIREIDRDAQNQNTYEFGIKAYEKNDNSMSVDITVTLYIQDIDDNPPVIQHEDESHSIDIPIEENTSGQLDVQIHITDADINENAQFSVELVNINKEENFVQAFLIAPSAGYKDGIFTISVTNSTALDYENPKWQIISFEVLAKGVHNVAFRDQLRININLIDYNDEYPIFEEPSYDVTVKETIEKDELIITVLATDRDAEDITLKHSLIGASSVISLIRIEETNGNIYVNKDQAFDYDKINPIFFQVRAEDRANHTTVVPVTITLEDVNNKAPVVSVSSTIDVEENQQSGLSLNTSITASDPDEDASLTAEIIWSESDVKKNFRSLDMPNNPAILEQAQFIELDVLNAGTGNIDIILRTTSSGDKPDYELFDSLYLKITVTDENTDPAFQDKKQTTVEILISIIDINDNWPIFTDDSLARNRSVTDEDPAKTYVGEIQAIDADVGDKVTYFCHITNPDYPEVDWFNFDESSGTITVENTIDADLVLDGQRLYEVTYKCYASDSVHNDSSCDVTIKIQDKNNKFPVIKISEDPYHIEEETTIGTEFVIADISDEDRDVPYRTVRCKIYYDGESGCFETFSITDDNQLKIAERVDRDEGHASYTCTLICNDNPSGQPDEQNSVNAVVNIVLDDINDNAPELLTESLKSNEHDLSKGSEIGKIVAKDIDEGLNALVSFEIDKVVKDGKEITNDLFAISETPIQNNNDGTTTAVLTAAKDMKTFYGDYIISLKLHDNPSTTEGTQYNTGELSLLIDKWNYETPKFVFPDTDDESFVFSSAQTPGQRLQLFQKDGDSTSFKDISITTEDGKCSDKWAITISVNQIEPSDAKNIFIISKGTEKCSAQLQINSNYNEDAIETKYRVEITAKLDSDRDPYAEEAPYETTITIHAQFLENADNPVFDVPTFSTQFQEQNEAEHTLLPQAQYEVVTGNFPVYYRIVTENDNNIVNEIFAVTETEDPPTLSLKQSLDYDKSSAYTFQILATNESLGQSKNDNSYLTVTVEVLDVNNHAPEWTNPPFVGGILYASSTSGTVILTTTATDADKIDDGLLTYEILEGTLNKNGNGLDNVVNPFKINSGNGDISMNFRLEATMTGYFTFDIQVSDVKDEYGNGPHSVTTTVTIIILTTEYTLDFKFENPLEEVLPKEQVMLDSIGSVIGYNCYTRSIQQDTENGVQLENQSIATLFFVDSQTLPIKSADIQKKISDISVFTNMRSVLRQEGLILMNFDTKESPGNTEGVLRTWLIGVSVALGVILLVVLIVFIIKIRELNRRLAKLTIRKFGSEESGLNRMGINAPTTNQHAVEGSNPIYGNDVIKSDLSKNFDRASINSGDSDLIGVEDNDEFDFYNRFQNDSSEYI